MENIESRSEEPKNLLQELQEKNPTQNVMFLAIEELKSEAEMHEFFQQYVELLKQEFIRDPEAVAKQNIGFAIGLYDRETAKRWMEAFPGINDIGPSANKGKKETE